MTKLDGTALMKDSLLSEPIACRHCGRINESANYSFDTLPFRSPAAFSLTARERQLVELVRQAKSNKEIAFELSLTVGSVKEYMYRLFRKLGVRNRTELALWNATEDSESPALYIS